MISFGKRRTPWIPNVEIQIGGCWISLFAKDSLGAFRLSTKRWAVHLLIYPSEWQWAYEESWYDGPWIARFFGPFGAFCTTPWY